MMSNKQVTATSFGYRYTFRLRNSGNLPKSLNPEKFSNRGSTLQFIRGLHLSDSHWRGLTHSVSSFNYVDWRNSNPSSGIEPYIAECLVRGDIQVFKHKISAVLKSDAAKRQFKTKVGMSYQFVPASSLLTSQPNNTESITTEASAKELIKKLELTEPQLEALVDALELSKGTGKIKDTTRLNETLHDALIKDEVIVCVETPNSATKSSEYGGSEAASNTKFDDSPHPEAVSNSGNSAVDGVTDTPKPSLTEINLAKEAGKTAAHIDAREKVARNYLENNGFSDKQIIEALGSPNKLVKGGVDFDKPLEIVKFPPPEEMYQYVKSHGNPGNWFDSVGKQTPDSLGVNGATRTLKTFKVPKGDGLLSRSKPIIDDWTVREKSVQTSGGGVQLFVNNKVKNSVL